MSTKKTIYLIRHGETDFNQRGIIQGSGVDSELNATGREQALKFFQAYHHISFDRIYTSELKRCIQSVKPFIDKGFEHKTLSELNEISWGKLEGLVSTPQSYREYTGMLEDWKAGLLDRCVEGGESPKELYKRQEKALKYINKQEGEEKILICTHGRAMRSFLCLLTQSQLAEMDQFRHSNLCLYCLEKTENCYEIIQTNSIEHLWI